MAGNFDFLHIKRRTAGSSNELSFDVLDLKSAEAAGKSSRSSKLPKAPKASQGSYHGVAGTSTLSGQAEVEKRKRARRASRLRLRVLAAAAIVALVAVGVYAAAHLHEERMDYTTRIHALVDRLAEVDETMYEIDAMMQDPLDRADSDSRADVLAAMPKLTTELNRITVDAQSLVEMPLDEQATIAVGQISKSAQARIAMINAASEAFALADDAADQVNRANRMWNDVLAADQLAREGIAAANKATTPEAATQALESTRQARRAFAEALGELREMEAAYRIGLADQESYLAKKVEALDKAVETSEALLAGDREAASKANDAYNDADFEAASLAAELPPALGELVETRFAELMEERKSRYADPRQSAVQADSVIRDYLSRN